MRARAILFGLGSLLVLSSSTALAAEPSLIGAWQLETYVDTPEGGEPVYAFGKHPIGVFVFSADGRASLSIMRNPPRANASITDPDPDVCVPEWYCSYFGTYTVDWKRSSWTVHVEGSNTPSFVGTDQTRAFKINDNRLVIADSYEDEKGRRIRTERVLVRLPSR